MTRDSSTGTLDSWVVCPNQNPQAQMRLFCFPYAGGGAAAYFRWSQLLPPDVELYAIRLPGRESRLREAPYVRLVPLIEDMAGALTPYLDKPFAFFGHSMGASLAFELTRWLRRRNMPQPLHLVASGHRAPHLPDRHPPLYHLPDDDLVREMDERYNGIPKVILENAELLAMFLPAIRADLTILDTYQYEEEAPLACPISTFGGDDDPSVTEEELSGWRMQTQGTFRLRMFAGDHFYLQAAQTEIVQAIIQEMSHHLAQ
jgi:medium-chain acyl-[acyl-carrier-protein] hydrolase